MTMVPLSPKRKKLAVRGGLLLVSLGVVGYATYAAFSSSPALPASFLEAWRSAAKVSAEVVRLTEDTNRSIARVNALDAGGDAPQALLGIREARERNTLAYGKAVELTRELQRLAESLNDIPSAAGQRLAYEAVATELSLVSEFIVYTESLNRFLDRVAQALTSHSAADRGAVESALEEVNLRARKINELNDFFLRTIDTVGQT